MLLLLLLTIPLGETLIISLIFNIELVSFGSKKSRSESKPLCLKSSKENSVNIDSQVLNTVSFLLALKERVFGWLQDGQVHDEEDFPSVFLKRERNFNFFNIVVLGKIERKKYNEK
jgi:hypothetical protein